MNVQKTQRSAFHDRVTLYSFILTILVIWIHAISIDLNRLTAAELAAADLPVLVCVYLQRILGTGLGQIAVPGFFCMSGYLFFRNAQELQPGTRIAFFTKKLRSRVKSLLLPYLIWNLIYFVIYLVCGKAELTLQSVINGIVFHQNNPVFWYMEELILLTLAAPFFYLLIQKKCFALPMLLLAFFLAAFYRILPIHPINEDAVFYYLAGATLALHYKEATETDRNFHRALTILGLSVFLFSELFYINFNAFPNTFLLAVILGRLAGVACVFGTISLITGGGRCFESKKKRSTLPCFLQFNFLIYAIHYLEIRVLRTLAVKLSIDTIIVESVGYLLMPFFCIAAAVCAGMILERISPKLAQLITGGRG